MRVKRKYDSRLGWKYAEYLNGFSYLIVDRVKRYEWYPIAHIYGSRRQARLRGKLLASAPLLLEACVASLNEIGIENPHVSQGVNGWKLQNNQCSCSKCQTMVKLASAISNAGGEQLIGNEYLRGGLDNGNVRETSE